MSISMSAVLPNASCSLAFSSISSSASSCSSLESCLEGVAVSAAVQSRGFMETRYQNVRNGEVASAGAPKANLYSGLVGRHDLFGPGSFRSLKSCYTPGSREESACSGKILIKGRLLDTTGARQNSQARFSIGATAQSAGDISDGDEHVKPSPRGEADEENKEGGSPRGPSSAAETIRRLDLYTGGASAGGGSSDSWLDAAQYSSSDDEEVTVRLAIPKEQPKSVGDLSAARQRNIRRQARLDEVGRRDDTGFFASVALTVLAPPLAILGVAVASGYIDVRF